VPPNGVEPPGTDPELRAAYVEQQRRLAGDDTSDTTDDAPPAAIDDQ
jgi:hypothetical protein